MESHLKVLLIDATTSFYRVNRYQIGESFGPVDLGFYLSQKFDSLNIGAGLLAGSIFPGSNRLIFTGQSPCWDGFYISSMGGAALVFDNLGVNMVSIIGRAPVPSVLYLNRVHGEEVDVQIVPVNMHKIWAGGRGGIYSIMDYTLERFGDLYATDPRILAVGPAAETTDFGAIASVPVKNGENTFVDTWAGRGGFGSKMLREHGIVAVIYGGTYIDEDFQDRNVANQWFEEKYNKKMAAKDIDATTKYRYDPNFNTGGTFGVNYATIGGRVIAFNYRSIYWEEEQRLDMHQKYIINHYLKQFNEETIATKQQQNCGEPCAAVCKKMKDEFKKDYEPYQTMGPLCGVFDQRAAEHMNHRADMYGFDGISVGGVVSWLMDCLSDGLIEPAELGLKERPLFSTDGFDAVADSAHNAEIGLAILDGIVQKQGMLNMENGARKAAHQIAKCKNRDVVNRFVFTAFARKGWMVPNQYWTAGALSPMAIMGKYYMHYGNEFLPPRKLGQKNADRLKKELILDNLGICRFHRGWAEDMMPDVIELLYGKKEKFLENITSTACRINSRNDSVFWESTRNADFVLTFLKRQRDVEKNSDPELQKWIELFDKDKDKASLDYWYEIHKGVMESLKEC
jgi:glyceraldehyde-3-phosphate dehydrogenase (ferredoxin)